MMVFTAILFSVAAAFLSTLLIIPYLIKRMKAHGITGVDVHKPHEPVCAEMGGLAVLLGFIVGFVVYLLTSSGVSFGLLSVFLTIVFAGFVGVVDDVFALRQRYKPFLVGLASVPLIVTNLNHPTIWFPAVGFIDFGLLYLFIVPLGVASASNLTNMLAGFNGLEAGVGTLSCFGLGIYCLVVSKPEAALITLMVGASFLAFLRYNWFPAKIFPGDTGTMISGAAVAATSIYAGAEFTALVIMAPAAIDFTLKMISRSPFSHRHLHGDTQVGDDGSLTPSSYPALSHAFLKLTPLKEKELVSSLLVMQLLFCVVGIILTSVFK